MKRSVLGLTAGVLAGAAAAMGGVELQPGVRLTVGDKILDDDMGIGHLVPTVADWNGDGRKDLIVGAFTGNPGNVRLYLNTGTDAEPRFTGFTCLEAGGKPIRLSGG